MHSHNQQPNNDVAERKNLAARLNASIDAYVRRNKHLLEPFSKSKLTDVDNRRWNIIKLKEIIKTENGSKLQLASRVLEHITSGVFTTGFLSGSKLRDSILKILHLKAKEIFEQKYGGFPVLLSPNPDFNTQPPEQTKVNHQPKKTIEIPTVEDDDNDDRNELLELLTSLNKTIRIYKENRYHLASTHNRSWNLKTILDIITIPDNGDITKFKYYTAEEVALRVYEHINSELFKTGYGGSTLRNDIYTDLLKHSEYLKQSWWNKPMKAEILNRTDKKHRRIACHHDVVRVLTEYNSNLRKPLEGSVHRYAESEKRYQALRIKIPRYKSVIDRNLEYIAKLKEENAGLTTKVNSLDDELTALKKEISDQNAQIQKLLLELNRQPAANLLPTDRFILSLTSLEQQLDNFDWEVRHEQDLEFMGNTPTLQIRLANAEKKLVELKQKFDIKETIYIAEISDLKNKIKMLERALAFCEASERDSNIVLSENYDEKEESHTHANPMPPQQPRRNSYSGVMFSDDSKHQVNVSRPTEYVHIPLVSRSTN
jgi:hypothetical protein